MLLCHSVVAKVVGNGAPFVLDGVADTVGVIVRAASYGFVRRYTTADKEEIRAPPYPVDVVRPPPSSDGCFRMPW